MLESSTSDLFIFKVISLFFSEIEIISPLAFKLLSGIIIATLLPLENL